MKPVLLTEEEIGRINSFIEEAIKCPIVEAIYVDPYFVKISRKPHLDIMLIYNETPEYNGYITGKEEYRDTLEEIDHIDELKAVANTPYNGRLYFQETYSDDYPEEPSNITQIICGSALKNGIILYDRFGRITEYRERIQDNIDFNSYRNMLQIENLDSITKYLPKNPVLNRKQQ